MLQMWNKKRALRINNTGSFAVEAAYVVVIIMGVILTMFYITMYCYDRVAMECRMREHIKAENQEQEYRGQLGIGRVKKSVHEKLDYTILIKYPLTQEYVENRFTRFTVEVRTYDKSVCEVVRMYDAIRNKE